jgi:ABC-2 type transport system ATP-binding protein
MIRQHLGVMYDSLYLNPKFKPIKIVELEKEMHPTFNQTLFDQMVSDLNIDLFKPFKYQSLSMKRKFDVALSLSLGKDIIFLDEPFNGVDPVYKKIITQYIQKYMEDENHTVIISSHQVIDLEKIADYILILDQGEVLVFEEKETLLDGYKGLNHPFKKGTQEGLDNLGSKHIRATLEEVFIHLVGGDL